MSGSNNVGKGAGVTGAAGIAVLPFTGGNSLAMIVAVITIACGIIILLSLFVRSLLTR